MDLSEHDGKLYTRNKKGLEMCKGFQTGRCCDTSQDNTCWYNAHLSHQCAYCLRTGHGAEQCHFNPDNKKKAVKAGKGGKGGKGGKTGKGGVIKKGKGGKGGKKGE